MERRKVDPASSISEFLLLPVEYYPLQQITEYCNCLMTLFLLLVHKFSELKDCFFHSSIFRVEHTIGYTAAIKLEFSSLSYFLVHETKV